MNKFNAIHGDEPNELPIEWNSQPTEAHFKYMTSTYKTNPIISAIMGRLNHHAIDNGDVKVNNSEFTVEYNSESVPDLDTTLIKSIDDDEMDHPLEISHSEDDGDILDAELHIIQV